SPVGAGGQPGGGGGRIAVYYAGTPFPETNISARGGGNNLIGGAGTIYLQGKGKAHGDLIVDNGGGASALGTPLRTALTAFRSLKIRNYGRLEIPSSVGVLTLADLTVDGSGSALLRPSHDLGQLHLSIANALTLSDGGKIQVDSDGLY